MRMQKLWLRFYGGAREFISCPREIGVCDSLPLTTVGKIACSEPEKQGIEKRRAAGQYTGGK